MVGIQDYDLMILLADQNVVDEVMMRSDEWMCRVPWNTLGVT